MRYSTTKTNLGSGLQRGYYPDKIPDMISLSPEEEKKLFESYARRRTARIREILVRKYLCWAFKLAAKMCGPRLDFDDAISAANVGLMEALETYDTTKGARFTTHSYFVIRRHLIEALVGTYPIHISQHLRKKFKNLPVSSASEEQENPKSLDELFDRLGQHTNFQVAEMFERPEDCLSVSQSPESPADTIEKKQTLDQIKNYVDTQLTALERKVFIGRHYKDPAISFEKLCLRLKTTKFATREAYRTALLKVQNKFRD
jgi:RNA polymerase sigma factor (sigma-70 family)